MRELIERDGASGFVLSRQFISPKHWLLADRHLDLGVRGVIFQNRPHLYCGRFEWVATENSVQELT
jgi:hypothetical protein